MKSHGQQNLIPSVLSFRSISSGIILSHWPCRGCQAHAFPIKASRWAQRCYMFVLSFIDSGVPVTYAFTWAGPSTTPHNEHPRSWSLPVSANELLWTKRARTHTFAHDPTLSPGSIMSSQKHLHFSPQEPYFSVTVSAVYLLIVCICLLKHVLVAEETVYKFPPACWIPGTALECPGRRWRSRT